MGLALFWPVKLLVPGIRIRDGLLAVLFGIWKHK
jgi:hypothetical protein